MKKVRIDWNNVQEPWSPIRFLSAGALNPDLLKAIEEHYPHPEMLRVVLDVESPQAGLDFLTAVSWHKYDVLLCLDGGYCDNADAYERKILPILWEACERCPNIAYLEIGNETALNGISDEDYYQCYRGAYHALDQVNHPIQLGGNGADSILHRAHSWLAFLQNLAADTDPLKRIDFYSFHLPLREYPVSIWLAHEAHIAWLKELNLPALPIFLDSLYQTPEDEAEEGNALANASTMLTAAIAATEWPEFRLFFKSALDSCDAHTQFTPNFACTPNAHAERMIAGLGGERLVCDIIEESWPPQKDIVAVRENGKLQVLVCNPTDEPTYIKFTVTDIPYKMLKIHQYLVDDRHNADGKKLTLTEGRYQEPKKIKNSENVEMLGGQDTREELNGTVTIECNLREHGFCLYTFQEY